MQMKTVLSMALAFGLAIGSGAAFAQGTSKSGKPLTAQQERMVTCNHEATGKTGEERKTFMSTCLKGGAGTAMAHPSATAAAGSKMTQQEKMKTCSADAKEKSLKGTARESFMSTCLKSHTGTAATPAMGSEHMAKTSATGSKESKSALKKTCTAEAKEKSLKGAAYKSFIKSCESGAAAH